MNRTINTPIVFLPIESTPREFDYKLNLARLFLDAGYDVMIGNPPFLRDELKYKNYQGMFLEKGVNPDPEYYSNLQNKNISLFCLSDEGASFPAFSVTYKPATDALKTMEKIFLWGEFQKDDLIARNDDIDLSSKYLVTGYPGLEFSLPKYKEYNKKLRPKTLPNEYILVNTNFAMYNGLTVAENIEACSAMSPETLQMIESLAISEEKAFTKFYEWLIAIIRSFPSELFLIRPHPLEKPEKYIEYFSGLSNVIVSKDGAINQALVGAKIVLHRDCTSALQSYIMGLPVISLVESYYEHIHSPWALAFGAQPKSIDEAKSIIAYILENKKLALKLEETINPRAMHELSQRFCNLGDSTRDILSVILPRMQYNLENFRPYKITDNRKLIQKIKLCIRKFMPLHYKVPHGSRRQLLPILKRDIQTRMQLLEDVDGLKINYRIKKLYPNVFFISNGKGR